MLREALAEGGLRLHDDVGLAAVEEEVVVLRGHSKVGARVEAKGRGRAEVGAVSAPPHGGVSDKNMRVRVADVEDRIPPGRGAEVEGARVGADEDAAVVGAAAAVVDAEGVADGDLAA